MSDKRICKYCGMELSEDVPHGLRECHLHAVARIAALKGVIEILEDQQREAKNILIDKNLHIDSLYEEGYKLHVHHVIGFANKEIRADANNLVLLCVKCHRFVHSKKNINGEFIGKEVREC